MAEIFLSSDHHFHHSNIIKYGERPFLLWQEMEDALVENHNSVVRPQDHWYCLGDFSILRKPREYPEVIRVAKRLNGHKRLILGNHDHCHITTYLEAGFEKIYGVWGGIDKLMLSHIPIHPRDMGRFRANVHGHTHQQDDFAPVVHVGDDGKQVVKPYINVCVERTNYSPISLDEINTKIKILGGES